MKMNCEKDLGEQPIAKIMTTLGLNPLTSQKFFI